MGIGKQSAPAAPDYSSIANASTESAKIYAATSREQLDWAKQQYNDIAPTTKAYLSSMIDNSNSATANAEKDRARYESIYQPMEDKFVGQAKDWNSPDRANQEAGAAQAEVANQFNAARKSALAGLESYGIDPSQTRYGALDLGTRVQQAAATAAAGTQSRRNTEATGLALEGEAINIGKGYPGNVAQSYGTATSAGSAGLSAANTGLATGSNAMGSPTAWGALGNSSNATGISALNTGFDNSIKSAGFNNEVTRNSFNMVGSLIGGALGASF